MTSIADTIQAKSDQLNADDLLGGPIVITITKVTHLGRKNDQPVILHYEGDEGHPYKPNKGMRRVLVACWGDNSGGEYIGRSLRLFRNPDVQWAGEPVGGIQIAAASHIDKAVEVYLQVKKGKKAKFRVEPLQRGSGQQQQRPAPTIDDARAAIKDAGDTARLEAIWSSERMAAFKEQLQPDYDARKAELAATRNDDNGGFDAP